MNIEENKFFHFKRILKLLKTTFQKSYYITCLIVSEHIIESFSEIIRTLFDLELLSVDLVLNIINPLVQLGDVHLSILKPEHTHIYYIGHVLLFYIINQWEIRFYFKLLIVNSYIFATQYLWYIKL